MTVDILKKIKKEAYLERGRQAIKFVKWHLNINTIDEPWLRSNYILMSLGFELILKSRVIALSRALDKLGLEQELKDIGHDFTKFFDVLKKEELKRIGLKGIKKKLHNNNYNYFVIKTIDNKNIEIENLNDIRYSSHYRKPGPNEHRKIIEYAELILEISEKIKSINSKSH